VVAVRLHPKPATLEFLRVRLRILCPDWYAEERAELVPPILSGVHQHGAVIEPLILSDRLDRGAMGCD
jgi:hypothetical protein